MCGIAGTWGLRADGALEAMVNSLDHRGPDDRGSYRDEVVALGMTRLAILDLSPAGHQPMGNQDGTVQIIYNGETYNFLQERLLLERTGHAFHSSSDTEVLLRMYEVYGDAFVQRLRGMFALAIYDRRAGPGRERLLLARDHLGIKPLLYTETSSGLVFASEMKALLASGLVAPEIDPEALRQLLTFGSVRQPRTMLKGVQMLLPAHWLVAQESGIRIERYWSLSADRRPDLKSRPYEELVDELSATLQETVRLQMISDVPLGAFLSGGIDSSVLVALMARSAGGRVVDGHAPEVTGKELNAYIAAGIYSDHESVSLDEAREKLRRGMRIMIREGSSEKNLEALLPLVTDKTYKRCMFVVDDRSCIDLYMDGDIDGVVRKAIKLGLEPVRAIQLATINTAEYFRLNRLGAVAPGYLANLIVLSDLSRLQIDMVFHRGRLVAAEGKGLFTLRQAAGKGLINTVHIRPFTVEALRLKAGGETLPVIEIVPGQIITRKRMEKVRVIDGEVLPDTGRDILKLVVVERHRANGNIGVGLVMGFGLKRGALASSIAHDSHNIVAVGASDGDIFTAVREVERLQGGLVIAAGGKVKATLPLPIAGLMSDEPMIEVADKLEKLGTLARDLGTGLHSPFATLSFLTLPVIPELRLTDLGLVDVIENRLL